MALFYDILAILLGTALAIGLTPYTFRLTGRLCGAQIKSKTAQRRELLLQRAVSEEKSQQDNGASSDEEWEKVNAGSKSPARPDTSFNGVIGFFHPFCNAGGGGERVLWTAVAYHQKHDPHVGCAVYSGDVDASKSDIVSRVKVSFSLHCFEDSVDAAS